MNEGYKDVRRRPSPCRFPLLMTNDQVSGLDHHTVDPAVERGAARSGPISIMSKSRTARTLHLRQRPARAPTIKTRRSIRLLRNCREAQLAGLRYVPLFDYFAKDSRQIFSRSPRPISCPPKTAPASCISPRRSAKTTFRSGKKLELPMVCPVDEEGKFTDEVPDYKGKARFRRRRRHHQATSKTRKRLMHRSTIQHRYPFCYRCDTPLIYKAITTWFMKIEPLKEDHARKQPGASTGSRRICRTDGSARASKARPTGTSRATGTGARRCRSGSANADTRNASAASQSSTRLPAAATQRRRGDVMPRAIEVE